MYLGCTRSPPLRPSTDIGDEVASRGGNRFARTTVIGPIMNACKGSEISKGPINVQEGQARLYIANIVDRARNSFSVRRACQIRLPEWSPQDRAHYQGTQAFGPFVPLACHGWPLDKPVRCKALKRLEPFPLSGTNVGS